jgi:hypothetical protein
MKNKIMKIIRIENNKKKWKVKRLKEGLLFYERIEKKFVMLKCF